MTTEHDRIERELRDGLARGDQPHDHPSDSALTPIEGTFEVRDIVPVVTPEQAKAAMEAYQALVEAVTDPSDYQTFTSMENGVRKAHKFRKRGAWKKIGRFFFVSTAITDERIFHTHNPMVCLRVKMPEKFGDVADCGCPIKGVRLVVRATDTRSGRFAENVGICVLGEKRVPTSASLHDLATRAFNRGANRATADLLGVSDPSAEERQAEGGYSKEERETLRDAWLKAPRPAQEHALTLMRAAGARGTDDKTIYIDFLRVGDDASMGSVVAALVGGVEEFDPDDIPSDLTPPTDSAH